MKMFSMFAMVTFFWAAWPDLNHEAVCIFWNPSFDTQTVIADFYVDGEHYTRHDGILSPWMSFSVQLKNVIPDLPNTSYTLVLTAPNLFYSWCWPV